MTPQINLVRAIGSEFIGRKLKPILLALGIVALVISIAAIWLTTLSAWWWLLAIPVIIFTLIGLFTLLLVRAILRKLRPELSKPQSTAVKGFVDKLDRLVDNMQTPMFIIIFKMVRDIVRPGKGTIIQTVTEDSTTLRKDLIELQRNFK